MSQIPPPQQPYQAPPGASPMEPHRGVVILVLGIIGLVSCPILGIIAWVMGNTDMQKIRAGQMDPSGEGLTQGGRICGMIATILFGIVLVICAIGLILFLVIAGGAAMSH